MTPADFSLPNDAVQPPRPLQPSDLSGFAINSDVIDVVKVTVTVPIRKPPKDVFIRTRMPEQAWSAYAIFERKASQEAYLVSPDVFRFLSKADAACVIRCYLVPTVDRRGNFCLWPVKISARPCGWHTSALRAAQMARTKWLRVFPNLQDGQYDVFVATSQPMEPVWPEDTYEELLSIAFSDKVIQDINHPVLKDLRGE